MTTEREAPSDAAKVRQAFRLGWTIAELRGRYRLGGRHVALPEGSGAKSKRPALPLARERSEAEQKRETQAVLKSLAESLELDCTMSKLGLGQAAPGAGELHAAKCVWEYGRELDDDVQSQSAGVRLPPEDPGGREGADDGGQDTPDPLATEAWTKLAELLYRWDAHIQDTLTTRPSEAAAYQLGRGLAEPYWALEPDNGEESWIFLLSDERRTFLKRQLSRLSAYTAELVPVAINQSLDDWCEVANNAKWRAQPGARADLHRQTLVWRDLIQGEREPTDLFAERTVRVPTGILLGVLRSFFWPLLIGVLGIAALVAGGLLLAGVEPATSTNSSTATSTVIAVLGALGVTAAGAYARAKGLALGVIGKLRNLYLITLVSSAATIRPKAPVRSKPGKRAVQELSQLASGVNSQVTRESFY